jgi:flagellum-specific peptidoglycan hydrolase FlgJ
MKQRVMNCIKVLLVLSVGVGAITYITHKSSANTHTEATIATPEDTVPEFFSLSAQEGLMDALIYYDIKHPEIVYAQAILETGHFKSVGCIEHNNLFGLYNSSANRYCRFDHWAESVVAYKEWVQKRWKPPSEDYYTFLRRIGYATDPHYTKKLKIIVNKKYDKRRHVERDSLS